MMDSKEMAYIVVVVALIVVIILAGRCSRKKTKQKKIASDELPQILVQETIPNHPREDSSVQPSNLIEEDPGETPLDEYLKNNPTSRNERQKLVRDVLCFIHCLHCRNFVHGDVHYKYVVVGGNNHAILHDAQTTRRVKKGDIQIINDIKNAVMLVYYILSGGESYPEGQERWDVKDITLDFIEQMNQDPNKSLMDLLRHPLFWPDLKKLRYLQDVGNLPKQFFSSNIRNRLKEITRGKLFENWRETFEDKRGFYLLKEMDEHKSRPQPYTNDTLGLLFFIRNLYQHRREEAVAVEFTSLFCDLFETIYLFAEKQKWNSTDPLRIIFKE